MLDKSWEDELGAVLDLKRSKGKEKMIFEEATDSRRQIERESEEKGREEGTKLGRMGGRKRKEEWERGSEVNKENKDGC